MVPEISRDAAISSIGARLSWHELSSDGCPKNSNSSPMAKKVGDEETKLIHYGFHDMK